MKKKISLILCGLLVLGLVGCGAEEKKEAPKEDKPAAQEPVKNENEKDGLKFTLVSAKKEKVKGDRTKDNYADENGDYFAKGSKILPTKDYENIVVKVNVENTTDKAIKVFKDNWSASLKDGYKFQDIKIENMEKQIPSKYTAEYTINILVEKKLKVKEIEFKYNVIDSSRMDELLQDAFSGKSEEECKEKYPELFEENYVILDAKF